MKTLKEIKDAVAKENGYDNWKQMFFEVGITNYVMDQVCIEVQKEMQIRIAENAMIMMEDVMPTAPGIEPITLNSWYLQQGMVLSSLYRPVRVSVEKDSIINNKNLIL